MQTAESTLFMNRKKHAWLIPLLIKIKSINFGTLVAHFVRVTLRESQKYSQLHIFMGKMPIKDCMVLNFEQINFSSGYPVR